MSKLSLPVLGAPTAVRLATRIEERLGAGVSELEAARALHALGVELFSLPGAEAYHGQMARAFAAAAEAGLPEGWVELGRCRFNGWGTPKDPELGLASYRRAAELGSDEGAYLAAANLYFEFRRDEEAHAFAMRALEGGDPGGDVRHLLGLMALAGRGRAKSPEDAFRYQRDAAAAGCPDAMFELSGLYGHGIGCVRSPAQAHELLVLAAECGHPRACYNLGAAFATGRGGVPQSVRDAVLWYERASEAGHGRASFTLAVMHRRGEGVPQDPKRADELLTRAERQGFDVEKFLSALGV